MFIDINKGTNGWRFRWLYPKQGILTAVQELEHSEGRYEFTLLITSQIAERSIEASCSLILTKHFSWIFSPKEKFIAGI